jgi:hypothetical protein
MPFSNDPFFPKCVLPSIGNNFKLKIHQYPLDLSHRILERGIMAKEQKKKKTSALPGFSFGKKNLYILGIGLGLLVIGYIMMSQPPVNGFLSLTMSPIVLLIAYLIVIPIAIMYGRNKDGKEGT